MYYLWPRMAKLVYKRADRRLRRRNIHDAGVASGRLSGALRRARKAAAK